MSEQAVYPYIPNSAPEVQKEMMEAVGITQLDQLYEEIPQQLRFQGTLDIPPAIPDEYGIKRHVEQILRKNTSTAEAISFLGAGCANHYVPAVVDEIITRGELLTCYGSDGWADHGKFQIFAEYNSMMCALLGTGAISAPQYDGGQSLATSICMANRINGRRKVLLPDSLNPQNKRILHNYLDSVHPQHAIEQIYIRHDPATGLMDLEDLQAQLSDQVTAVVCELVSFLGMVETNLPAIGRLARDQGAEFIVYTDPITLGVLETPMELGATILCGDLHSLGIHQGNGSGQAGFISTRREAKYLNEYKDYMYGFCEPEVAGELAFGILLNYRTHYSQRAKGKEYTGTGKNLWMAAACVYMALMGPKGFEEVGETMLYNCRYAQQKLASLPGVSLKFSAPCFHEFVVDFNGTGRTVEQINRGLLQRGIFGGLDLSEDFPELGQCGLYSVTETTQKEEIDALAQALGAVLKGEV